MFHTFSIELLTYQVTFEILKYRHIKYYFASSIYIDRCMDILYICCIDVLMYSYTSYNIYIWFFDLKLHYFLNKSTKSSMLSIKIRKMLLSSKSFFKPTLGTSNLDECEKLWETYRENKERHRDIKTRQRDWEKEWLWHVWESLEG